MAPFIRDEQLRSPVYRSRVGPHNPLAATSDYVTSHFAVFYFLHYNLILQLVPYVDEVEDLSDNAEADPDLKPLFSSGSGTFRIEMVYLAAVVYRCKVN